MKRRNFFRYASISTLGISLPVLGFTKQSNSKNQKEFYELREFQVTSKEKIVDLDGYLKNALIPALNKHGVKYIGAFHPTENTENQSVYLLIPYQSLKDAVGIMKKVAQDADFQKNSKNYDQIGNDDKVCKRIQSSLLEAFDAIPKMKLPQQKGEKIFELRVYESYNEDAGKRKVEMFNKEELDLFYKVGFEPVFFGETIFGINKPNLTYMLVYENMEEREKEWKAFIDSPEWAKMKDKPEYADSVSKVTSIFLNPAPYSQL
ncbi:MAG: NIPSNAP family protein [Flammeovirgaceae bacterium]|nr:NIPSNAP family protein [Flammeovirgaceae bacterium]